MPCGLQDMASWSRDGVAGLQSVVLYSLPELDGAIDTVPLGGLVNNDIYLVPERVHRLAARIKKWVDLRRTPPAVRTFFAPFYATCSAFFTQFSHHTANGQWCCNLTIASGHNSCLRITLVHG